MPDIQPVEMIFPGIDHPELVTLYAPAADLVHTLTAEEAQAVASAVDKRRHEYATGRWLARRALAQLGYRPASIPSGPHREPVWPASVRGSVTHAGGLVAVAVTTNPELKGIGIDLEKAGRVGASLLRKILTDNERHRLGTIDPTLLFSAKEACYKVLYPMFGEFVAFQAVEIDVREADNKFSMHYVGKRPQHAVIERARGSYVKLRDCWFTCVTYQPRKQA